MIPPPSQPHNPGADAAGASWQEVDSVVRITGIATDLVTEAARAGLVMARHVDETTHVFLDNTAIFRLRQVHELRRLRNLDWEAVCLVIRLQARVEALESEVRVLREADR